MRFIVSAAMIVFTSASNSFAQTTPPGPGDFVAEFTNVRISPDGEHVATIRPFQGRSALVIYRFDDPPASGGEEVIAIPSGDDVEISNYMWASNDRLLIQAGFSFENPQSLFERIDDPSGPQLISIGFDGSGPIVLGDYGLGNVANRLPNDPDHVLIVAPPAGNRASYNNAPRLYHVSISTGQHEAIRAGRIESGFIWTNQSGRIGMMTDLNYEGIRLIYWRALGGGWRRIYRQRNEIGSFLEPLRLLNGGNNVYLISNHEGRRGLYVIRPDQSNDMERVFLHDTYDASGLGYNPLADQATYATYVGDFPQRVYFDNEHESLDRRATVALPGTYVFATDSNDAGTRYVFTTGGAGHPTQYYLYDTEVDQYRMFALSYPSLSDDQMARVEAMQYAARDGLVISGYLAFPTNLGDGPHPVIVFPHDGPAARDTMAFDRLRQFFATRGYVVFQPNFRGSTGFGNEFLQAGWEQWGRGMQDDITDGVRHLIAQGIADPDRICIAGWSYGAYAALLGAATTPELYRCAIGINGVYDVEQLSNPRSSRYSDVVQFDWDNYLGDNIYSLEAQREISPRYRADDITVPILIIASEQDPQARVAHSEDMIVALREAGVPHESRIFEAGNHSLNYGPSWQETLELVEAFLEQNLPTTH